MSQVEEVRAGADIVKVIGDYVKLRKAGANFVGLCPFHQEKTPSFAVHPVKQIFHCFGCGVGGDVFEFVMRIESLTFPEALRRVADQAGIKLREKVGDAADNAEGRERTALHQIHEAAAKFFATQMSGTGEGRAARALLADRGVSDEAVGRFRLGYAPSDGQALWRHLSGAGFAAELLEKSGLVLRDAQKNRYYDRFRRRIIFPITNPSGKVVAFGGRAWGEEQPKYLNSPETPIYTKGRVLYHLHRAASAIRRLDYAVLVEGYMDCIAVDSCGVENVVASCGTSLTEAQVRLMARYSHRIVVNYDPDSAGVAATERSLDLLLEAGFEVKVLALPAGLDPDSFVKKRGGEAYLEALRRAPNYLEYLTDRAIQRHGLQTPEGKIAAVNALMPFLAKIPNLLLRREIADQLAARLRVDDRLFRDQLKLAAAEGRHEMAPPRAASVTHLERKLLRAFLENPKVLEEYLPALAENGVFEGLATAGVFTKLLEACRQGETLDVHQLRERLTPEGRRLLHESLLGWGDPSAEEEILGYCNALRRRMMDRERTRIQTAIEDAMRRKDEVEVAALMRAKDKLIRDLSKLKAGSNLFR